MLSLILDSDGGWKFRSRKERSRMNLGANPKKWESRSDKPFLRYLPCLIHSAPKAKDKPLLRIDLLEKNKFLFCCWGDGSENVGKWAEYRHGQSYLLSLSIVDNLFGSLAKCRRMFDEAMCQDHRKPMVLGRTSGHWTFGQHGEWSPDVLGFSEYFGVSRFGTLTRQILKDIRLS